MGQLSELFRTFGPEYLATTRTAFPSRTAKPSTPSWPAAATPVG